jgi:hypothetical protein
VTRRQLRRHARRHPILAAVAVLVGLVLAVSIAEHLAALVVLAAIAAGAYAIGRNRRPATARTGPAPVQPARPVATSADTRPGPLDRSAQLAAEIADLRRQLADARASAEAAWDAAAERPPVHHAEPGDTGGKRTALLADPLGGARPLVGR